MKVLIDENLSPRIAGALAEIFKDEHQVHHIRAFLGAGVADTDWINKLSKDGKWIVISGDRRITKNRVEYYAFRSSNLVGFFLTKGLYKSNVVKQLERILALWSTIETQQNIVKGGAMFTLPLRSTKIDQLKI